MRRLLTVFAVLALGMILSADGVFGAEASSATSAQNAQPTAAAAIWNYLRSVLPRPVIPVPPQGPQTQPAPPATPQPVEVPLPGQWLQPEPALPVAPVPPQNVQPEPALPVVPVPPQNVQPEPALPVDLAPQPMGVIVPQRTGPRRTMSYTEWRRQNSRANATGQAVPSTASSSPKTPTGRSGAYPWYSMGNLPPTITPGAAAVYPRHSMGNLPPTITPGAAAVYPRRSMGNLPPAITPGAAAVYPRRSLGNLPVVAAPGAALPASSLQRRSMGNQPVVVSPGASLSPSGRNTPTRDLIIRFIPVTTPSMPRIIMKAANVLFFEPCSSRTITKPMEIIMIPKTERTIHLLTHIPG